MKSELFEKITSSENSRPALIAEMSGNHASSFQHALKFVDSAISEGADIIKFQVYTPDTITLKCNQKDFAVSDTSIWKSYKYLYDLYSKAHTPWDWIAKLAKRCDDANQPWFASPFDSTAVEFLEGINCPAYKLASPEISDHGLLTDMCKTGKPIILSIGLTSEIELEEVLTIIKKYQNKFAILKCTSAYPAPLNDLNLSMIPYLAEHYGCPIGYSDHSEGEIAALTAVALGATIIEKHFKLDEDEISVDSRFSMKISELSAFKEKLLEVRRTLGEVTFDIPPSARASLSGRRSLYVTDEIKSGSVFSAENIRSIRPSFGLEPKFFQKVIGKRAMVDLKPGDRLTPDVIEDFDI